MAKDNQNVNLFSDNKIAETSSKGNQEKWNANGKWYKLDQFGYEALSEVLISRLLTKSNIEVETPFKFVRYEISKVQAHDKTRVACVSDDFLQNEFGIVTVAKLLSSFSNKPIKQQLGSLSSDKKRIEYLVSSIKDITGLKDFDKYLSVLFEIDCRFLNDDRHLNNIAVILKGKKFDYCPIFDNGATLLSNIQYSPLDIEPKALISKTKACPFNMTFNRLHNTMQALYGNAFVLPKYDIAEVSTMLDDLLEYYPSQLRTTIKDRVITTIRLRQNRI